MTQALPDFNVFLSHSSSDQKWADRLNKELSEHGVTTFFDRGQLEPGGPWSSRMKEAAQNAHDIVVLVGGNGQPYEDQSREARAVLEAVWNDPAKRVIPVLMGDAEPPGFVRNALNGDVKAIRVKDPRRDWGRAVTDLLKVLRSETSLDEVAEMIDTKAEDRKDQKERLSYIRDVADLFPEEPSKE